MFRNSATGVFEETTIRGSDALCLKGNEVRIERVPEELVDYGLYD